VKSGIWFLRQLGLFEGIAQEDITFLHRLLTERECRRGQDIAGDAPGHRVFIVKRGRVRVLRGDVAVAILGPGQFLGTAAFFGPPSTGQRAIALDDVMLCEAPATEFLAALAQRSHLAARVVLALARQLEDLEEAVERSASEDVDSRLADFLLRLADRSSGEARVRDLSQAQLARMLGVSRESVSRAMAEWERQGYLRTGQRSVAIKDELALRAASHSSLSG